MPPSHASLPPARDSLTEMLVLHLTGCQEAAQILVGRKRAASGQMHLVGCEGALCRDIHAGVSRCQPVKVPSVPRHCIGRCPAGGGNSQSMRKSSHTKTCLLSAKAHTDFSRFKPHFGRLRASNSSSALGRCGCLASFTITDCWTPGKSNL